MSFVDRLNASARAQKSILCMGLDPVVEKIPIKGSPRKVIETFYLDILGTIQKAGVKSGAGLGAVKPNIAFYEQHGIEGLEALKTIITAYKKAGYFIILDAKRSDITSTAQAYAKAAFDFWDADAVTVGPYLGSDCVSAFAAYGSATNGAKGVYVLARTSNPSAAELQNLKADGQPLYMHVAKKITQWSTDDQVGAVVGATYPSELAEISAHFAKSKKQIPLLIPGVGKQGGSAKEIVAILKTGKRDIAMHRINASSSINYAYLDSKTKDYAGAAVAAIKKLNKEIGF